MSLKHSIRDDCKNSSFASSLDDISDFDSIHSDGRVMVSNLQIQSQKLKMNFEWLGNVLREFTVRSLSIYLPISFKVGIITSVFLSCGAIIATLLQIPYIFREYIEDGASNKDLDTKILLLSLQSFNCFAWMAHSYFGLKLLIKPKIKDAKEAHASSPSQSITIFSTIYYFLCGLLCLFLGAISVLISSFYYSEGWVWIYIFFTWTLGYFFLIAPSTIGLILQQRFVLKQRQKVVARLSKMKKYEVEGI